MDGMRKRARLGQKVSSPRARTGCLTCRKKKVKCDEGKPDCERCLRLERECTWDEPLRAIPTSCLAAKSPAIESPHVDTASTNYGHHFTAFKPPENDLSLVNHPMQSSTQFKFELALQNGPESFQTFKPATGLAVPSVDHDDSGVQSNSQLSLVTYETPIALQSYSQGFKFHFLLECNGCRQTTLRQHPWCFAQIQDMFQISHRVPLG
ncbi:hypothetical protein N431DRAFT_233006 [Stipitochalara longipes BDJ]|nr:hypothetical protein N431DRAFT_233006 [Stipitochalara longipes BDJ]